MGKKVGRNDRCACGSGKKYKRCHGSQSIAPNQVKASDPFSKRIDAFIDDFSQLDQGYIDEQNEKELQQADAEFTEFKALFESGECPTCRRPLGDLSFASPCIHWLLNPPGFKKKHFDLLIPKIEETGLFRLDAFLRWVANLNVSFRNINDLKSEKPNMLVEHTITYNEVEWSFSCSETDYSGHEGTASDFPHYHFQMRLKGFPFINYSDHHLPLTDYDKFVLEMKTRHSDKFTHTFTYGAGMSELLSLDPVVLIDTSTAATDESKSALSISSMFMADEGTMISGDLIADMIEESQRTGKTIASIAKNKLPPNAKARVLISEGEGVKEKATRGKGDKPKS